jgi:D-galactarolactone cycloisomerase
MLRREELDRLPAIFAEEASKICAAGYTALKMKIGLGPRQDVRLVETVRRTLPENIDLMVDANHCYVSSDAMFVGHALDELNVRWFEEPVAPEDLDGYSELRSKLNVPIAGGEAEFTRWGWRELLLRRCVDIAQPEVCAVGGITEYLKVLAMAHAHFIPVNNHVWGSALSVATNIHLLAAMPSLPGGLHPWEPMLELDTTPNLFRSELALDGLEIERQICGSNGTVALIDRPGIGIEPDSAFINKYRVP